MSRLGLSGVSVIGVTTILKVMTLARAETPRSVREQRLQETFDGWHALDLHLSFKDIRVVKMWPSMVATPGFLHMISNVVRSRRSCDQSSDLTTYTWRPVKSPARSIQPQKLPASWVRASSPSPRLHPRLRPPPGHHSAWAFSFLR